ncbi:disulfide bond formation protein B [Hyphobacterium marinum]|uniref:Disulfide bond formation protein B n=1 Tax=Hyphobacterium marinum TaxID=3116574 RepID=A0ABU7LYQ3_9PROT|nr:disulfide bond formation protein B [Hyphobacterium sp. Y6023]MEE2566305.1 disulfide bond formation protein B [Hyphobacterium sp. Y6023]
MITRFYTADRWPFLAAGASFLILCGAWFFQYGLGYEPCALCFDQRHIHWTIIGLGLVTGLGMVFVPSLRKYAPIACMIVLGGFLYSAGFAGWHAGIEYGWWDGPASCTTTGDTDISLAEINAMLNGTGAPLVLCDEAAWTLLGISMAGYNAILSALLAIASGFAAFRPRHG